jgi:hypothetical protein
MKSDHGRWPLPMVQSILKNNQFTKYLGPSLGVNQVWTKINDHVPENECANFFYHIPKKGSFGKKKTSLIILLSSLVFIFSSLKK